MRKFAAYMMLASSALLAATALFGYQLCDFESIFGRLLWHLGCFPRIADSQGLKLGHYPNTHELAFCRAWSKLNARLRQPAFA
ncbi:MAG: hypothetical protein DME28_05340 [Verrucomicrobia bacterium]|nr:MAG: hypothetical protein DME28_05340 [Verrucomicrobiota bacterium]